MTSDRRLVVMEAGVGDPDEGRLFALAPNQAAGIGLPAFDVGAALPATGSVQGAGYFSTALQQGFVWSGQRWLPIAPTPILRYDTEAALLADTAQRSGSWAIAADVGSLWVKKPTGWAVVGIATYRDVPTLLADNPAVGSLAEALDEGSLWEMVTGGWRCMSMRELADTAAVKAWTATAVRHGAQLTITTPAAATLNASAT